MPTETSSCACGTACATAPAEPIVCTLAGRNQAARASEFRDVFAHLERTEALDSGFRWHFRVEPGLEARLRDLARREHECCRFFAFRIELAGDTIVWETSTDESARPILEALMRLPETLKASDIESMKRVMNGAGLTFASDCEEQSR